jgi:diacylglycerol kinase family enzyme
MPHRRARPGTPSDGHRRAAAAVALVLGAASLALAAVVAVVTFPRGLVVAAGLLLALLAAWTGVVHRGAPRVLAFVAAVALAVAAVVLAVADHPVLAVVNVAGLWLALVAARTAFRLHVELPAAPRPRRPVLLVNPRSGDGAAARTHLVDAAHARGIETVELSPGTDLEALARRAVAGGADALAMAGGDGSQAIVAAVAAEHELPYACVPAGTRNHWALDLGVDRADVVGALDALVDGSERRVDLAEVNGRVFVNNASLGVYAEAVQRDAYRHAKLRTLLETVPDAVVARPAAAGLHWRGPDGHRHAAGLAVLVSNNRYRLGRAIGSGTRPQVDAGTLGLTVLGGPRGRGEGGRGLQRPWREWSAPAFDVEADGPVPVGVDGEALVLEPPLRFRTRPGALRVRVARRHPGASPSAAMPGSMPAGVRALARIALGR